MNNRILSTIEKFNMIEQGDRVLVGVSGGADSMLLLSVLSNLRDTLGITLEAAHIEHGIRGLDSVEDMNFVSRYCSDNNIPLHILSINAVDEAKRASMSVEEYARKRRYEFFTSIECDKIATAHNLTDNIETVLFRLARGTGLKGVCGIPPVRGNIIRPLIEISSSDIRAYCADNTIPYRIDCTNLSDEYSRNNIRNNILPVFGSLNKDYQACFQRFINDVNEDYSLIASLSDAALNACLTDRGLFTDKLNSFDVSIKKRVIIKYFSMYNISLDRQHLNEILSLSEGSGRVQLKDTYYAVSSSHYLRLADLNNDGCTDFISEILNINEFICENIDFYCDCDKIIGKAYIRARRSGDCIRPAGRNCTKPLKKLYNELGIPIEQRNNEIVVCDDDGVIGIIGYCADERVRLTADTKRVFCIKTFRGGLINE